MNDCVNADVRDALPDFINNRLSELDAATVREHIESCVDCKAEVELIREARATAFLAPKMDVNRIASALPAYAPVGSRSIMNGSRRTWALAAAAVIVAVGGWAVSTRQVVDDAPAVAVAPATRTAPVEAAAAVKPTPSGTVPTTQSQTAATTAKEVDLASLSLVGSTDDLSDEDLESLVAALDGIDAMPSAEPGSVTTTVEDIDGSYDQ